MISILSAVVWLINIFIHSLQVTRHDQILLYEWVQKTSALFQPLADDVLKMLRVMFVCHLLPCDAMHSAAIAVMRCPSVCLSVCHVRELRQKNKDIFENFSPSGSQAILVFPYQTGWRYSDRNHLNGGVKCKGVWKNDDFRPISRSISETFIVRLM